jgi:hypothetical protein
MEFDRQRVLKNVRDATTEDLLDRVTVYRVGMEPAALAMIEAELEQRGIDIDAIEAHACERNFEAILYPDGTAVMCNYCHRPAVMGQWGWFWSRWMIWGKKRNLFPLWPRYCYYCSVHKPGAMPQD